MAVKTAPMIDWLDGPDDGVERHLADARLRFAHHVRVEADGVEVPLSVTDFPSTADVRRLDKRQADAVARLPIIADAGVTGRLPAGTVAVAVRLPPVLGEVVFVAETPGREPRGELVAEGKASEPMGLAPFVPPAPPATRPASRPATQPATRPAANGDRRGHDVAPPVESE